MITASRPFSRLFARLSGSALALALSCGAAAAEQVTLRVHHFLPATSSAHIRLILPWCDKIAKESDGQLKCQIYPAMQLGGTPAQLFDQAKDGVADLVWTVPTYAAGRFSKAEIFELPWMAATSKAGSQALWSFVENFAQDEFHGVQLIFMHVHDGALFHFVSKQPKTLEEMKGLKIRAATRANSRMIAALGAAPVQMPLPQVPESLAKGVIDGAAVPWEGAPSIKLNEIAKYHLDVPAASARIANTIFLFGMNKAKYDGLPPALKRVIDANSGLAVSAWAGEIGFDRVAEIYRTEATTLGGAVHNLSDAEYKRWVEATRNVEEEWVKEVSAKAIDGRKLLAEARRLVAQFAR